MRKKKLLSLSVFLTAFAMLLPVPLSAGAAETETFFSHKINERDVIISSDEADANTPGVTYCAGGEGCRGHKISGVTQGSPSSAASGDATSGDASGDAGKGRRPNTITVKSGTHNIVFAGVTIDAKGYTSPSGEDKACAFDIQNDATVNLTLEKGTDNKLVSESTCAGIRVMSRDGKFASLNIDGEGSLDVRSVSGGAGIGADQYGSAGNITINGGNVTAYGAKRCAGIGGAAGSGGSGGNIKINGGNVTAYGGDSDEAGVTGGISAGAGIGCGGGCTASKGNVVISGGTVNALGGENKTGSGRADGINCSTLSSDDKSATVFTNGIYQGSGSDKTDMLNFNAMVWKWDGKKVGVATECTVYGNAIMNAHLKQGQTIDIPKGCTLAVIEKDKYDLAGTITGDGTIINKDYLRDDGGNAEKVGNQMVSLTEGDIKVDSTKLIYTGKDRFEAFTKNTTRKVPKPTPNDPDAYDEYLIDNPDAWQPTIVKRTNNNNHDNTFIDAHDDYEVHFTRKGYPDVVLKDIEIKPKELTPSMVIFEEEQSYTGSVIEPKVKITYDGKPNSQELTTADYYVSYGDETTNRDVKNKGEADPPYFTVNLKGSGNYCVLGNLRGKIKIPFSIVPDSLADADFEVTLQNMDPNDKDSVTLDPATGGYTAQYRGKAYTMEPVVTAKKVSDPTNPDAAPDPTPLVKDTDYTVKISPENKDPVNAGIYTYTIAGIGNYQGEKNITFEITPKPISIIESEVETEATKEYDTYSEIPLKKVSLDGVLKEDKVQVDLEATKAIICDTDGNPVKDVSEPDTSYTTILLDPLKLSGTDTKINNYSLDDYLNNFTDQKPLITLAQGITITPATPEAPELSAVIGDEKNKFTCTLTINKRPDNPIYEGLQYEYRYRPENADTEGTEGDGWIPVTTEGSDDTTRVTIKGLDRGNYIFEARSIGTSNVSASEFGSTVPEKITEIDRLEAESAPSGFRLESVQDTSGESFILTLIPPENYDPAMAVEYCIAEDNAEIDVKDLKYKDFESFESNMPNPNKETGCEATTSYIAYVRYKQTDTRKASKTEESDALKVTTETLQVQNPTISFYEDEDDNTDDSDNEEDSEVTEDTENTVNGIINDHEYIGSAKIQINCDTPGVKIYYTLDGSEPTKDSTLYEGPFTLSKHKKENLVQTENELDRKETTIKAVAIRPKWTEGKAEDVFSRQLPRLPELVLTISKPSDRDPYSFINSTTVTIECKTDSTDTKDKPKIYYTMATGEEIPEDPTTSSDLYPGPFSISQTVTIKAIAVQDDMTSRVMEPVKLTQIVLTPKLSYSSRPKLFARTGEETADNNITPVLESTIKNRMAEEDAVPDANREDVSDKIGQMLYDRLNFLGNYTAFHNEDVAYYDFLVMASVGYDDPRKATASDFPEEGYTFTIDYPDGTDMDKHDFALVHMFEEGESVGKIEDRVGADITKTPKGLQFTLTSASPIAIAWTDAEEDGPYSNNKGDGSTDPNDPNNPNASGDPSNPSDPNNPNASGDPTNPNNPNASGDPANPNDPSAGTNPNSATGNSSGDAAGTGTNGTGGTASVADAVRSAAASLLPKTGDTSKIMIWIVLAVACVTVIVGVQVKSKKGHSKKKKH